MINKKIFFICLLFVNNLFAAVRIAVPYDLDTTDLNMLLDIYNYIIMHTKKRVTKDVRNQALEVLFHFIHLDLDQNYFGQIKDDNEERENFLFHGGGR